MSAATISVVVPVLDEERAVAATLAPLREPDVLEVIVVDGGSRDRTRERAAPLADLWIESSPGRARQMNAGAARARGEVLFFLHADTLVPPGFAAAIRRALDDPSCVAGRFDVELDDPRPLHRLIGMMIRARSRATRLFTGDQAIFVRRAVFERVGGYPDEPLMEDLALARKLRRAGEIASLRERVVTSSRRWNARGTVRTILTMWTLRSLYALGVGSRTLARWYAPTR